MASVGLMSPFLTAVGDFIVISLDTGIKSFHMRINSPACDTAADQEHSTLFSDQIHHNIIIYLGVFPPPLNALISALISHIF